MAAKKIPQYSLPFRVTLRTGGRSLDLDVKAASPEKARTAAESAMIARGNKPGLWYAVAAIPATPI